MIGRGHENIAFPTPNDHTALCSFCENKSMDLCRTGCETRIKKPHW